MSYSTYNEYLHHPRFLESVTTARLRAGGKCEDCGAERWTEPHHITYCPWGEFDPPENLRMLCRPCHENAHRCGKCGQVALKSHHIKTNSKTCFKCQN